MSFLDGEIERAFDLIRVQEDGIDFHDRKDPELHWCQSPQRRLFYLRLRERITEHIRTNWPTEEKASETS